MKKLLILAFTIAFIQACGQGNTSATAEVAERTRVLINTTEGDIIAELYNETPLHRDNFIKLAEEGFYDSILFHRVIEAFMIQGGDPHSRDAEPGEPLGAGGPGYTIPAEIVEGKYHIRGAIAAARQGDQVNPQRESSGSQFYITQGRIFTHEELDVLEERSGNTFTTEQRRVYTTIGGTPHLDNAYTVFGIVVEGMDVLDRIAATETDSRNRPLQDIFFSVKVLN